MPRTAPKGWPFFTEVAYDGGGNGEGFLSDDGMALYNLLVAFGWTPQKAYSFAYDFDMGDIPVQIAEDTLTQLEREFEQKQGIAMAEEATMRQRKKEVGIPLHFSSFPMGAIKEKLLEDANSDPKTREAIARAQADPVYQGVYGQTVEDWANRRAQEIHFGTSQGELLGFPSPEVRDFESRLQGLRKEGKITDQEYADALFLRTAGNIPLDKGGSTELQKINAAEYFLANKKTPELPQGDITEDYLATVPGIQPPQPVLEGGGGIGQPTPEKAITGGATDQYGREQSVGLSEGGASWEDVNVQWEQAQARAEYIRELKRREYGPEDIAYLSQFFNTMFPGPWPKTVPAGTTKNAFKDLDIPSPPKRGPKTRFLGGIR